MPCDHKVEQFYNIGSEHKKIGTLTDEDLNFLIMQAHPGFNCQPDDVAAWICKNEDIRILNDMLK
jgi:1,2-phenylacetyl-CoA epoxidase PaaB subunit